jgi:hypothetical protein
MRMPQVGDKVVCIEDESLGTVVYLTAGGSPEIKFDDGSHGTYMLREFAELFGYTTPPAQEIVCSTGLCHYKPAAPVQSLPFCVGGGLVAIKTLLSRDPCVHANTAIEMIDAILKEHPAAQPAPNMAYSIDADSCGIRKRAADAIIGALALGAQDSSPPPEGHWLQQFWDMGRAEASKSTPPAAQRQWVGLTDEQKHEIELKAGITEDDDGYIVSQVFRLTEAKLKEENT